MREEILGTPQGRDGDVQRQLRGNRPERLVVFVQEGREGRRFPPLVACQDDLGLPGLRLGLRPEFIQVPVSERAGVIFGLLVDPPYLLQQAAYVFGLLQQLR